MKENIHYQNYSLSIKTQMRIIGLTFFGFLFIFSVLAIIFLNPDPVLMSGENYKIFDFSKFYNS